MKQCLEHLLENHDRAPLDLKIASMEADGQVLTIHTSEPRPALLNYLGDPYACIIDVDAGFDNGIVAGTGPYIAVDCESGDHLTLVKNENYWNGTPKIDELTIRTILGWQHAGERSTSRRDSGGIRHGLRELPAFSELITTRFLRSRHLVPFSAG